MYLFNALPWVVPLGFVGTTLGLALLPVGRRRLSLADRILRAALIGWGFVMVGAVIAPGPFYIPENTGRFCALEQFPAPDLSLRFGHRAMNELLFFVPGILTGLLTPGRCKLALGAALVLASPFIEFVQWFAPVLARSCQLEDVSDNWFGLMIGLLAGVLARAGIFKLPTGSRTDVTSSKLDHKSSTS